MQSGPLFVSSGDLVADRRYKWALDYVARGDALAAADILSQVVEEVPRFATAWFALGAIRDRLGDRDGAVAAFTKASDVDPEDYHGARLQLARLGAGEATPAMTEVYVRRLFDDYAPRFDASLTERLAYRAPALLRDAVQRACLSIGRPLRFDAMLDLGCGTGLAGGTFRDCVDDMTGVDLSPRMVEQARAKALYERLETRELLVFLDAARAEGEHFDLIVAADVFVYMAGLDAATAAAARVLAPGGLLAFTVETHAGPGVVLSETLRYAHGLATVRNAVAAAGLTLVQCLEATARTEKGAPVPGLVVVASTVPCSAASHNG